MPLFANSPGLVILGTGEIFSLILEPCQRIRGKSRLLNPTGEDAVFVCDETPHRSERLGWLFTTLSQSVPQEPAITPVFILENDTEKKAPLNIRYLRNAHSLQVSYFPTLREFHVYFYWNLFTPLGNSPPQTSEDNIRDIYLSNYKLIPVSWTLPLDPDEPHFKQLIAPDPKFSCRVGDPPVDPGGAWPGVYNALDQTRLLAVGGGAFSKNSDPFQGSDDYQNLPGTPGYVIESELQDHGSLLSLGSIEGLMNDHTQNLYFQREIQALRMSTRVLMFARGIIQDLILEEDKPADDDPNAVSGILRIGSSSLIPGVVNESYIGLTFIVIENTEVLFPHGAAIPGFVPLKPGNIGHQFKASGGQEPYSWCLRRTRSSSNDPAREPPISPAPPLPPYPFDGFGDLLDPETEFPEAVQGGGLPPGMILDRSGLFYGTPTRVGTYVFRLHVKDVNGLRGESTVRFLVLESESQQVLCATIRGLYPAVYKTTITNIHFDSLSDSEKIEDWTGKLQAVGGQTGKYFFFLPRGNNNPYQQVPQDGSFNLLTLDVNSGDFHLPNLNTVNFDTFKGVWVFEVQAVENTGLNSSVNSTCDIRVSSLSIGTTQIAGVEDPGDSIILDGVIPEGKYQKKGPIRSYLILNKPVPVSSFIQGKNVYLRGNKGFPLNPQYGGFNSSPEIITSVYPGVVNPVQVIGLHQDSLTPSHYYLDWSSSNPCDFFRDIYDRFDPVPVTPSPPAPPGSPVITGAQIDDMIVIGKRVRPLWPV